MEGCGDSGVGEERESVTIGRDEIESEIGKVAGIIADLLTMDSLGKFLIRTNHNLCPFYLFLPLILRQNLPHTPQSLSFSSPIINLN